MYKSVTTFWINNADFPTLTPLSPGKLVSDCVSLPSYKSVHNSFIKPVHKPSYTSSIKLVPVDICTFSGNNSSPIGRCECGHVSINCTICKASVTHFSEYTVNIRCKVFKVVLPSLSVNTVSFPPANAVKVTITLSYQYPNAASKYAVACKSVLSTSYVNTSPA